MSTKSLIQILPLAAALLLGGCAGGDRYSMSSDKAPANAPDVSKLENAHPRYEPYSRQGNKRYTVLGKTYNVMPSGQGFTQQGLASWYGAKFHGHLTSNGETYDMYSMSAAHKTLPLPSYVKVTNLDNQRQVIVRVNDRGPFHDGRIIDLSYAAAAKLDMLKTGTASVKIEALTFAPPTTDSVIGLGDKQQFIQIAAAKDRQRLIALSKELSAKYQLESRLLQQGELYKLQLGPIGYPRLAQELLETIRANGYPESYLILPAAG
ncbi:septal ring lipoprotein RlpA [Shewanella sp. NFH-SH190041]|uniref:septal ring lytic transglycosylase RlpA family protein n=1 Tax=Shewanella sp. NFH-SH190041 TaxID=2950245 RepID=UPI0021C414C0|nr:septal ring lytic transglycosylase RlpA family protein [Shewanella sp. NFH-SH190041]BDM65656.1 septal ring lipoprotein RlpA [Shewanella sp. NFH-SH190041]